MEIEYGAEVIDKNNKKLGTVDYIVRDTYTGDVKRFKVKTELIEGDLFFSPDDVLETAIAQIKLKSAFDISTK
jgi:hypothetical protein